MVQFVVEDAFWELFPEAQLGVVVCNGIGNKIKDAEQYASLLREAEQKALTHLTNPDFIKNDVIRVWREALQQFKTKKGARASIEALLKRVQNGNQIGTINPLVDIYNSVSLEYALPCGGEDIDTFDGDIRLTRAIGGEDFVTLGSDESAPPYEGEVVYKDNQGAICRCWNWRESVRTMLTEETTNAFLCIELVDTARSEDLKNALECLAQRVQSNLGGTAQIYLLTREAPSIVIKA